MKPYRYARLQRGDTEWRVVYYFRHPVTDQWIRKRVRVDHQPTVALRKRYAQQLINTINDKLDEGWLPLHESGEQYISLQSGIQLFLKMKASTTRIRSLESYRSRVGIFASWLQEHGHDQLFIQQYTATNAQAFMDHLLITRKSSPTTHNNMLIMLRSMWKWWKDRGYTSTMPFHQIKKLKEGRKKRVALTRDEQQQLSSYLRQHDPQLYLVCMLIYYCGLRPKEIRGLQVQHLDMQRQLITVPADVAKNGKERVIEVVPQLHHLLLGQIAGAPLHFHIFSTRFDPGPAEQGRNSMGRAFDKARKALQLRDGITLYSLKDTVAARLDEAKVPTTMIRDFFDHASVGTTDKYLKNFSPVVSRGLFDKVPPF